MKNIGKHTILGILTLVLMLGFIAIAPVRAQAFEVGQLIDPFCWFACDNDHHDSHQNNPPPQIPIPTIVISASPSSVNYNGSSTITWNSSNATYCSASGGSNGWGGNKNLYGTFFAGTLTNTTTFYIACVNSVGQSVNNSVTVNVNQIQTCQDSSANNYGQPLPCTYPQVCQDPSAINYHGSLPCRYPVQTCQDTSANNYGRSLPCTYTQLCQDYTAINYHGTLPCRYQNYDRQPDVNLSASDTHISSGDSTYIEWDTTNNPDYCTASGGRNGWSGEKSESGGSFYTGQLYSTTTYRITCSNDAGSSSDSVTVTVDDNNNYNNNDPVTVTISADKTRVNYNEGTTIRYYPDNATYCYGSNGTNGWATTRSNYSDSFYTGPLTYTTTYTITCNGYDGVSRSRSVTVNVTNISGTQTGYLNVVTEPASLVSNTSAELNSTVYNTVNNIGNAWFEWGETVYFGMKTTPVSVGNNPTVKHTNTMSGLLPGTTYHFRAVVENSTGRVNGATLSFTTSGIKPTFPTNTVVTNTNKVTKVTSTDTTTVNKTDNTGSNLGANVFWAGFLPNNLIGWIILIILVLILLLLSRQLYSNPAPHQPTEHPEGH